MFKQISSGELDSFADSASSDDGRLVPRSWFQPQVSLVAFTTVMFEA